MRSELREIPDRLLRALADAPVMTEEEIDWLPAHPELSAREVQVLAYLSRGLSREDTAAAMGVTVETVKTYLARARLLLRAKSDTHACSEALRQGLIT